MNIAIDELNFGGGVSKNVQANKSAFSSKSERPWQIIQTQTSDGPTTWEIELDSEDGTKKRFPLQDASLQAVWAWLIQNKDLL